MLGDGWNDAPALTQADLSLTLTSGTDATLEAADIILLTPDLNRLLLLFKISQSTLKLGSKKTKNFTRNIHPSIGKKIFLYFIIILVPILSIILYIIKFFS